MTEFGWEAAHVLFNRELDLQEKLAAKGSRGKVLNTPLLMGGTGAGKSDMVVLEAVDRGRELLTVNCGDISDPAEFGIAVPQGEDNAYIDWAIQKQLLRATQEPMFLFFDDLPISPPDVQGTFLSIAGNRTVRDRPLHPGTLIAAAGNRLQDDMYANQLSESLRTRVTIIEMKASLKSFAKYATETGEISPTVLGYLQFKPEHLFQHKEDVNRFPTPRGWWEVSRHFEEHPDPYDDVLSDGQRNNWKLIVGLKCGWHVANDFWAWFQILKKIDLPSILYKGVVTNMPTKANEQHMMNFAAIFSVSIHLAREGVEDGYIGLETFATSLSHELRVAMLMQLSPATRHDLSTVLPAVSDILMKPVTG